MSIKQFEYQTIINLNFYQNNIFSIKQEPKASLLWYICPVTLDRMELITVLERSLQLGLRLSNQDLRQIGLIVRAYFKNRIKTRKTIEINGVPTSVLAYPTKLVPKIDKIIKTFLENKKKRLVTEKERAHVELPVVFDRIKETIQLIKNIHQVRNGKIKPKQLSLLIREMDEPYAPYKSVSISFNKLDIFLICSMVIGDMIKENTEKGSVLKFKRVLWEKMNNLYGNTVELNQLFAVMNENSESFVDSLKNIQNNEELFVSVTLRDLFYVRYLIKKEAIFDILNIEIKETPIYKETRNQVLLKINKILS